MKNLDLWWWPPIIETPPLKTNKITKMLHVTLSQSHIGTCIEINYVPFASQLIQTCSVGKK